MVDPNVDLKIIFALREELKGLIDDYYTARKENHSKIVRAATKGINAVAQQVTHYNMLEIKKIRAILESPKREGSQTGFVIDLLIACIMGPIIGHYFERLGQRFVGQNLANRTRDLDISTNLLRDENVKTLIRKFNQSSAAAIKELDPEATKKAYGMINRSLAKHIDELRTEVLTNLKKTAVAVSAQEFVMKHSAAANDVFQSTFAKIFELFHQRYNEGTTKSIYDKDEGDPGNAFSVMDRIGREVRVYYDKVNELDEVFRKFYLALHNISFDEETLSNQIRYFKNQKGVRDKNIPEPGKLETMFEEFFEAVMWIIYLGDPYKWVDFDAWNKPKLVPIDEETIKKYTIERLTKETRLQQLPASFKVT